MTIRKAKRNWVEGKKISTVSLQMEQQHEQVIKGMKNLVPADAAPQYIFDVVNQVHPKKVQVLNQQFDSTEVRQLVTKIQSIVDGLDLTRKQQYDLVQQIIYINAIANDKPLSVNGTVYANLTKIKPAELREVSDALIAQVRNPILSEQHRLKAQLNLIAVMREQYFRTTGQLIHTNQILTVLMFMAFQSHSMLMVLDNEEEKSIATVLLAAMQWAIVGGTVDVCVANSKQIMHQYNELGTKNFFTSIGVPSATLGGGDPEGTYQVGGINYSTIPDLALYEGIRVPTQNASGYLLSRSLIINGSDGSKFDANALFSFSLHNDYNRIVGIYSQFDSKQDLIVQRSTFDIDRAYQLQPYKKNQELAVERYYVQTASGIQQTVLKQFDEWTAFLYLIHPRSEWRTLDNEFFIQREDLIASLEEQWTKCLEASDPEKVYPNPYIRRDVNNKLQRSDLDHAVQEYERAVGVTWNAARSVLKEKTAGKIIDGSINALRCTFLEGVLLSEQLQLNKLAVRKNKIALAKERQNTNSYLDSGLDVNGAMIAYSDVPKREYKLAFAKNQLKLLVKDTSQVINSSSLSDNTKTLLLQRVSNAENFLDLELVLNDYNRWLAPELFTEKYRMQPVVNELMRLYKYLGLQESDDLQVLKKTYIDNVALEVVESLESSLSWAIKENRGLGYWLERTAVQNAAKEILNAVNGVKLATDAVSRQKAIKDLYKILVQHQAQLEDLWIFSFGHQNTRDLINNTLNTLDSLTAIGRDQLDDVFIKECKEAAHSDLMKEQFRTALQQLEEKNSPWLKNNPQWNTIKEQLNSIQNGNNTVYSIDELYYFLSKISKELNGPSVPLFKPVIELRGEIRNIWNKFYQNHKELISQSRHFESKAENLQEEMQGLAGYNMKSVRIKPVQNGFSDSFDLIIEGKGSNPLFNHFIRYNSQISFLNQERVAIVGEQERSKAQIKAVQKLQTEQIPLLKSSRINPIDLALFPERYRDGVNEILVLKGLAAGKLPDDFSVFSQEEQNYFHDRNLVKTFHSTEFSLEEIDELKDVQLKAEFIELYNKVNREIPEKPTSLFSRIIGFVINPIPQESSEDWSYQFAQLQTRSEYKLTAILQTKINKKVDALASDLVMLQSAAVTEIELQVKKIKFLEDQISEEEDKTGVIIKRFETIDELYDFESELRKVKAAQPQVAVEGAKTKEMEPAEEVESQSAITFK